MANSFQYKDKSFAVGDTVTVNYKIIEGDKERSQLFKGIIIRVKGNSDVNRMVTIRKNAHMRIGVERIIPLQSPNIISIALNKKSNLRQSKIYFIRHLSEQELRNKLYSTKTLQNKK